MTFLKSKWNDSEFCVTRRILGKRKIWEKRETSVRAERVKPDCSWKRIKLPHGVYMGTAMMNLDRLCLGTHQPVRMGVLFNHSIMLYRIMMIFSWYERRVNRCPMFCSRVQKAVTNTWTWTSDVPVLLSLFRYLHSVASNLLRYAFFLQ